MCDGEFDALPVAPCWAEIDLRRKRRKLIKAVYILAAIALFSTFQDFNFIERVISVFLLALGFGIAFIVDVDLEGV